MHPDGDINTQPIKLPKLGLLYIPQRVTHLAPWVLNQEAERAGVYARGTPQDAQGTWC